MKRLLIFLITMAMLVSVASCAAENADLKEAVTDVTDETSAETKAENNFVSDDLKEADFNGYEFRIWSSTRENQDLYTFITYGEMTGDVVQDALYQSTLNVEERFNTKINGITCGSDDVTYK